MAGARKKGWFVRTLWILGALAGSSLQPIAGQNSRDRPFELIATVEVSSKYYWRGFDVTGNNAILQPSLTFSHDPSGLWFDLWASASLTSREESRTEDEVDLTFGWDWEPAAVCGFVAGAQLYLYPSAAGGHNHTHEVFGGIEFPAWPLETTVIYYHDLDLGSGGYLENRGSHAFGRLTISGSLGLSFGQYTSKRGFSDVLLGASYAFELAGETTLSPYLKGALVGDRERNSSSSEFWFGLVLSWGR